MAKAKTTTDRPDKKVAPAKLLKAIDAARDMERRAETGLKTAGEVLTEAKAKFKGAALELLKVIDARDGRTPTEQLAQIEEDRTMMVTAEGEHANAKQLVSDRKDTLEAATVQLREVIDDAATGQLRMFDTDEPEES